MPKDLDAGFTLTLFVIPPSWKKLKQPSTVEWINELCYVHTIENYKAMKINKVLPVIIWMNFTNTVLSKEARLSKDYKLYSIYI